MNDVIAKYNCSHATALAYRELGLQGPPPTPLTAAPIAFYTVQLQYGNTTGKDPFALDRAVSHHFAADQSRFLHPIISYSHTTAHRSGRTAVKRTHHVLEDVHTQFDVESSHIAPLRAFLRSTQAHSLRHAHRSVAPTVLSGPALRFNGSALSRPRVRVRFAGVGHACTDSLLAALPMAQLVWGDVRSLSSRSWPQFNRF